MGGDQGPLVVVPAALLALAKHPMLSIILVGDQSTLETLLKPYQAKKNACLSRLSIHPASQVVAMDESLASALRTKRDSSMRVSIDLVKQGTAHAAVSAGNTGALMAIARFVLKTLPGIDRPAIVYSLPTMQGQVSMLDLGANVECQANHLVQFALMGSILSNAVGGIEKPKVALLNIGTESIKGNEAIKQASLALSANPTVHYIGYVEGDDIYKGTADVVVCDGFVGNVALKTSEGLAKMILHFAKQEFLRTVYTRVIALLATPILKALNRRVDPRRYNGASLLGLRGIVIKSHGNADEMAFARAIDMALLEVKNDVPNRIEQQVATQIGAMVNG